VRVAGIESTARHKTVLQVPAAYGLAGTAQCERIEYFPEQRFFVTLLKEKSPPPTQLIRYYTLLHNFCYHYE
jgi:hypothetical protein